VDATADLAGDDRIVGRRRCVVGDARAFEARTQAYLEVELRHG
jgi:hypothetical protein